MRIITSEATALLLRVIVALVLEGEIHFNGTSEQAVVG